MKAPIIQLITAAVALLAASSPQLSTADEPSIPGKVYTTSWYGGEICVTDTATWTEIKRIPVGVHDRNVFLSPDRKFAWITNNNSGTVTVIDTAKDEIAQTVKVGKGPRHTYFSPDGAEAYVTNEFDATVSVIDPKTYKEVAVLTVGKMPHFPIVVKDKLFVTNFGNGHTCVFNRAQREKSMCLIVGDGPLGAGATKDGKTVVVACHLSNHVAVIDAENLKIIAQVATDPGPVQVTVTPNQRFAYVTNDGVGTVQKIDLATNTVARTIPISKDAGTHGITFAADGKYLLITNTGVSTLSVIDTESDTVVKTVSIATSPEGIAFLKK
jgi:YVTN family beta-propeller protein